MPFRDRNLLRGDPDTIPQRLHNVDSFIDCKAVERGGGERIGLGIGHLLRTEYSA
jgi:hypothetical protein